MLTVILLAQLAASSPPPTRFELSNGLRVWVQEDHSRPVALVHITYHAGSLNEGPGITGIAHYVEHMVYRATENIRNEDVYGYIDRIGGRYTGGTWPDVTRYAETVPSWAVESALRVTAERMTRALFDSVEFERERSNVVTEAHGFADMDPLNALRDTVMLTAFRVHPYRYNSDSWARDNLRLTRAQAHAWYRQHYGPNNAVLVVVGDVSTEDVRRLIEKHFGALERAWGDGRVEIVEPVQQEENRIVLNQPADSARLEMVYHAPSASDPDFPLLMRITPQLSARLQRVVARRFGRTVKISVRDTATAYPHVLRVSAAALPRVRMTAVLAAMDSVLDAFETGEGESGLARPVIKGPSGLPAPEAPSAVPPRRSALTRMAESLAAREAPAWEVSQNLRDSLSARAARLVQVDKRVVRNWLQRSNRTVGILQPRRAVAPPVVRIDVPALTTLPAKRLRPEPVPERALEPLAPVSIDHAHKTLKTGVRLHAARVAGDSLWLRLRVERGNEVDSVGRAFSAVEADSMLRWSVRMLNAMMVAPVRGGDEAPSADQRARARVIAAVGREAPESLSQMLVSVALVGAAPAAQTLDLLERHFASVIPSRVSRRPMPAVGLRDELIRAADQKQVRIVAGLSGASRNHRDRRALELLNYIVGVPYYGGRLGWALTKSGLTYSAAAQTYFGDTGHILLSTTADTRNTPAVLQAIREVIDGVSRHGVEAWELREAQAFMLGRTILYGVREDSSPGEIAAALASSDGAGLPLLDLPALSRAYLDVTLDDVNRVARHYYRPDRMKVVAVGAIPSADVTSPFPAGTFRALFEP